MNCFVNKRAPQTPALKNARLTGESDGAVRLPAILGCLLIVSSLVLAYGSLGTGLTARSAYAKIENREMGKHGLEMEEAVLTFTNKERRRAGLPILERSTPLNYLARGQSRNMCDKQTLQHESDEFPTGWRKFQDRLKMAGLSSGGENVAYLTSSPEVEKWAKQVVEGWMKSPPHKKNILNAKFLYLGVGVMVCRRDLVYVTQVFSPDAGRLP